MQLNLETDLCKQSKPKKSNGVSLTRRFWFYHIKVSIMPPKAKKGKGKKKKKDGKQYISHLFP